MTPSLPSVLWGVSVGAAEYRMLTSFEPRLWVGGGFVGRSSEAIRHVWAKLGRHRGPL